MAVFVLRPFAIGAFNGWGLAAGASKVAAVDPGDPVTHDDATSYLEVANSGGGAPAQSFTLGSRPSLATLTAVTGVVRYLNRDNPGTGALISLFARMNGSNGSTVTPSYSGGGGYQTLAGALPRPGGGSWTIEDVLNGTLEFCFQVAAWGPNSPDNKFQLTTAYIQLTGTAQPAQIGQAIDRASRELALSSRGFVSYATRSAALHTADAQLGQVLPVHYRHGKSPDGKGWGEQSWARRKLLVVERAVNPQDYTSRFRLLDLEEKLQLYSVWHTMRSAERPSPAQQGLVYADAGVTRQYTRAGRAWAQGRDGVIYGLDADVQRVEYDGHLAEPYRQNFIYNSSFVVGVAGSTSGWTLTPGTGGTVALDTSTLWFEVGETPNSLKLTKGTSGETSATTPASAQFGANAKVSVSVYGRGDTALGSNLGYRVQRAVDSFYLQADKTWAIGVHTFAFTADGSRTIERVENFGVGGDATTLTVIFVIASGATSALTAHLYHAQAEEGEWSTSPIMTKVTSGAVGERNIDRLDLWTDDAPHAWPAEHGTLFVRVVPHWSSDQVGGLFLNLLNLVDGLSPTHNEEILYWHGTNGAISFQRKAQGTALESRAFGTVTAREAVVFAARWTSDRGELGLASFSNHVFFNGAKGSVSTSHAAWPLPQARRRIYVAHNAGTFGFGAHVSDLRITPLVLSDEVIFDVSQRMLSAA